MTDRLVFGENHWACQRALPGRNPHLWTCKDSTGFSQRVVPTCSDPGCETQIAPGPQLLSAQIKAKVLVGWAKEKKAIAVDVHELILKFSDLSCEAVIQS